MFSPLRMVSYFWELGGDVLALYHCKRYVLGCPSLPHTSRIPLSLHPNESLCNRAELS